MKKTFLLGISLCLVTSLSVNAESDIYIGVEQGIAVNEEEFDYGSTSRTFDNDYDETSIKLGIIDKDGWQIEGSFSRINFDNPIFDTKNKELSEIGIDFIKTFDKTDKLKPFIKLGAGFGWMDVEGYDDESINEVSFNLGGGLSYYLIENVAILAGVDVVGRAWQDIELTNTGQEITITGVGVKAYAGVNYYF